MEIESWEMIDIKIQSLILKYHKTIDSTQASLWPLRYVIQKCFAGFFFACFFLICMHVISFCVLPCVCVVCVCDFQKCTPKKNM